MGSFITYLNELVKEVEFQLWQKKENTRAFEIRHRTLQYLLLIQKLKLASGEAIRTNDEMIVIRYMIRTHPLPEHQGKGKRRDTPEIEKVNIDGKLYDVPTSFNFGTTYCGDTTA